MNQPEDVHRRLRRLVHLLTRKATSLTEIFVEFGNYIGGDLDSDNESDVSISPAAPSSSVPGPSAGPSASYAPLEGFDDEDEAMEDEEPGMAMQLHGVDGSTGQQVVLHEDKKYYATAEETYGPDVEALVQEEDLQPLSEPIVQPIKQKSFTVQEKGLPETRFDRKYVSLLGFRRLLTY